MPISLEPHGDSLALTGDTEDGKKATIVLSEADVMTLAQSAPRLTQLIAERYNRPEAGFSASAATQVARIRLNTDLHKSEILLGLIDGRGAETTFALSPEVAQPLAERLAVRLAEIAN